MRKKIYLFEKVKRGTKSMYFSKNTIVPNYIKFKFFTIFIVPNYIIYIISN